MAKQLKAIQCPKCGSTQQSQDRPGLYHCLNCGTEYYLDSDDQTIIVRYENAPSTAPAPGWSIGLGTVLVGLLVVVLGVVGAVSWLQHRRGPTRGASYHGTAPDAAAPRWLYAQSRLLRGAGGQPVLVAVGNRTGADFGHVPSVGFYDARTGQALKLVTLPTTGDAAIPDLRLKQLSDGSLYVIYQNAAYRLSVAPPAVADATAALVAGQRALAAGVASLEAGSADDDGLNVVTNDGQRLVLYPLVHRAYTSDEQWETARGRTPPLPGSRVHTGFAFSQPSHTYENEPVQLLTYQYRDNAGGPYARPTFSWQNDYGGSGVFTSADPHRKVLIDGADATASRLLALHDFTPGRPYFNPTVLYHDADYVLITYQPTAAPTSAQLVQALDARTAAIVLTTPLPTGAGPPTLAQRTTEGFVVGRERTLYPLSLAGRLGTAVTCGE